VPVIMPDMLPDSPMPCEKFFLVMRSSAARARGRQTAADRSCLHSNPRSDLVSAQHAELYAWAMAAL
jgi:hypothetical protein